MCVKIQEINSYGNTQTNLFGTDSHAVVKITMITFFHHPVVDVKKLLVCIYTFFMYCIG